MAQAKKGKTALKQTTKFNWKKFLPVIILVALVGGFFVWRSFAGTKLYPSQYSVYQCAGFDAKKIKPDDKCVNESSEAMTYRLYQGLYDRDPDTKGDKSGYKYWTQKLAGDRMKTSDVAAELLKKSKLAKSSNADYAPALYKNMTGRNMDAKGAAYWKKALDSKKWTKAKVAAHTAAAEDAKKQSQAAFATFLAKAPKVVIVENAKKDRDVRLVLSTQKAGEAKKNFDSIKDYVKNAKKNRDVAKGQSAKNPPSRADLTAIAENEKAVRNYLSKVSSPLTKINAAKKSNQQWYDRAKAVAAYSPDISADGIKKQYEIAAVYAGSAAGIKNDLTNLIKEISGLYKTAEGKYEADLIRKAKEADARNNNGDGDGTCTYGDNGRGGCNPPPATADPNCGKVVNSNMFVKNDKVYKENQVYRCNSNGKHTGTTWGAPFVINTVNRLCSNRAPGKEGRKIDAGRTQQWRYYRWRGTEPNCTKDYYTGWKNA